ncbi:hypothetical protein Cantr_09426 [Candida viswanathii]|uniref:Uncharacterized protein n=1 Tax=Candida viswanathii TaxID=5486 RepID=A0A367YA57_9ASCO|nr:hypothetical protein Cantr_09426 [Candida viswanathii]
MSTPIELLYKYEKLLTEYLQSNSFTANLLITPVSKFITESLVIVFVLLLSYEIIYWSGIYLKLWDYHAKDIFGEVPIHCSHVYVRLNIIDSGNVDRLNNYYHLKSTRNNFYNWKKINELSKDIFKLNKYIKYYFEFSPEDFEMNDEPEFGSTIEHLRNKILLLVRDSDYLNQFSHKDLSIDDVKVYNNRYQEVEALENNNYLSKCHIETGNTIDVVIVI